MRVHALCPVKKVYSPHHLQIKRKQAISTEKSDPYISDIVVDFHIPLHLLSSAYIFTILPESPSIPRSLHATSMLVVLLFISKCSGACIGS